MQFCRNTRQTPVFQVKYESHQSVSRGAYQPGGSGLPSLPRLGSAHGPPIIEYIGKAISKGKLYWEREKGTFLSGLRGEPIASSCDPKIIAF